MVCKYFKLRNLIPWCFSLGKLEPDIRSPKYITGKGLLLYQKVKIKFQECHEWKWK
jgi:hypothetical protein